MAMAIDPLSESASPLTIASAQLWILSRSSAGIPTSSPMTCEGTSAQTSCTASIDPAPAASMMLPQTVLMLGSSPAITRARKCADRESRCSAWRGGSIARSMSCIIANESGSRSSSTTPPRDAENRFGCRDTSTTSAWRSTAQ